MEWLTLLLALLLTQVVAPAALEGWTHALQGFDLIRSQAFERADPALLHMVYPASSPLLTADRHTMTDYRRRNLQITDLRMQIVSVRVIDQHRDGASLDVVDRLAGSSVRMPDGSIRALPRDRPTRRVIELSRTDQGWRISAVRQR